MCHVFCVCLCVCMCVCVLFSEFLFGFFFSSFPLPLECWLWHQAIFHFRLLQTILPSSWYVGAGLPSGKELHWISWGKPCHPTLLFSTPFAHAHTFFLSFLLPGTAWQQCCCHFEVTQVCCVYIAGLSWPLTSHPCSKYLRSSATNILTNLFGKEMTLLRSSGTTYNFC